MKQPKDMTIVFDTVDKTVLVHCEGRAHILPGPFADRQTALAAAEIYCRKQGWVETSSDRG
ncbi:hypothetical protein [Pararhizobium gei]|uniref:hypothetical protein n=1 Tax=Pararhizobium gei TaxID=1395951 RepID=UPI0023DA5045|nr:hypothetical protein [Rhizobium gei]